MIIDQHEDDFRNLCEDGPKFVQDESDLQQQALKQQLDDIISGWTELDALWQKRKNLLEQSMNYQVLITRLLILLFLSHKETNLQGRDLNC